MKKLVYISLPIILIIFIALIIANHIILQKNRSVIIEEKTIGGSGQLIEITNAEEVLIIKNILKNRKYSEDICQTLYDYKINCDNKTYYLKTGCKGIQRGKKQANISEEELNTFIEIIKNNS